MQKKLSEYMKKNLSTPITMEGVQAAIVSFIEAETAARVAFDAKHFGIINFGKYKGKSVKDVYLLDKPYLAWMKNKSSKFLSKSVKEEIERLKV